MEQKNNYGKENKFGKKIVKIKKSGGVKERQRDLSTDAWHCFH